MNGHPLFAVTGFLFLQGAVLYAGWNAASFAIRRTRRWGRRDR